MAARLSKFEPIAGIKGISSATKGELRCNAIQLKSGALCLFSPVAGLNSEAKQSLDALGSVEYLLAPNHYHNKGLAEYAEAYPKAQMVAPEASHPRLTKQTGLSFESLDAVADSLPKSMTLVYPEGLKTGEVWVLIKSRAQVGVLMVDTFCGAKNSAGAECDQAQMLGTFPKFGVQDKTLYTKWLADFLTGTTPTLLVPCHGAITRSKNLGQQLKRLCAGAFD